MSKIILKLCLLCLIVSTAFPVTAQEKRTMTMVDLINGPTHIYLAPHAGHDWSELRHRLYKMNIVMEWFENGPETGTHLENRSRR